MLPSSTSSLHLFGLETDFGLDGWATGETAAWALAMFKS